MLPLRIYLIGFMGSGKTHHGKRLATRMEYGFLDLDDLIVSRTGRTISQLFAEAGDATFRKIEREALHSTRELERYIISCGGGTPCYFDNMAWINAHGLSIYLQTAPELLHVRLLKGRRKRPLIAALSEAELWDFIIKKMEERAPFYRQAAVIYQQDVNDQPFAEEIHAQLLQITGH